MNLYIACPYSHAALARQVAASLWAARFNVVSTWHNHAHGPESLDHEQRVWALGENLRELRAADGVVVLAHVGSPGETYAEIGRYLERRATQRLPAFVVWTHGPNGDGMRLSADDEGVERVLCNGAPSDAFALDAACERMRGRWLAHVGSVATLVPAAEMAVAYQTEDEDNQ
jgi:hypothetical protein